MVKETTLSNLDYEKLLEVLGHKDTQPSQYIVSRTCQKSKQ